MACQDAAFISIARKLGLIYNGRQHDQEGRLRFHIFTIPAGTSFCVRPQRGIIGAVRAAKERVLARQKIF